MRGRRVERIQRTCEGCGVAFFAPACRVAKGGGRFCSKPCRIASTRRTVNKSCETCGATMTLSPSRTTRFCSKACIRLESRPITDRFWQFVSRGEADACWEWQGALTTHGYGQMSGTGRPAAAHRVSYELHNGPIPAHAMIRHSCDNRRCVNPRHLEPGDHLLNARDMMDRGRSKRGSKHHAARLTARIVQRCRRMRSAGTSIKSMARAYGVTAATMSDAVHGRTWSWL